MKRSRYALITIVFALCLAGAGAAVAFRQSSHFLPGQTYGCTLDSTFYLRLSSGQVLKSQSTSCASNATFEEIDQAIRRLPHKNEVLVTEDSGATRTYSISHEIQQSVVEFNVDTDGSKITMVTESSTTLTNPVEAFIVDKMGKVEDMAFGCGLSYP